MPAEPIEIRDLTLGYDRHPAVHHLSGRIESGSLLAVVGPNGAGKSTLLKGLVGELKPLSGSIQAADLKARRFAYVPQKDAIDATYPVSVFDLVAMGLWNRTGLFGGFARPDEADVSRALAQVGLSGFERRPVGTLSGGQLQRALFARVTLQDAAIILLDEPFSAVDNATVSDLMAVVGGWGREGRTVIAALHDFALVRAHFPATLLLAREAVDWGPTARVLTSENLARARGMNEAFDDSAPLCEAASVSGGAPHDHRHGHEHSHDHDGHHHGHAHRHGPGAPSNHA